jgi:hypothetical protein
VASTIGEVTLNAHDPCMPYTACPGERTCSNRSLLVKAREHNCPPGHYCCPLLHAPEHALRAPLGYESFERRSNLYSADPKSASYARALGNPNGPVSQAVPARVGTSREQAVSIRPNSTSAVPAVGCGGLVGAVFVASTAWRRSRTARRAGVQRLLVLCLPLSLTGPGFHRPRPQRGPQL